jgi:hypothetical protein
VRVILPFTRKTDRVVAALDASGFAWEPVDVSGSDRAYYDALYRTWAECAAKGDDLVVVEHDIEIRPTTLSGFARCDDAWCCAPYPYRVSPSGWYGGLGCCRFSAALLARHADAIEAIGERHDSLHPPRHWCRLDAWLKQLLKARGEAPVGHESVHHLGDQWPSHGCVPRPSGMR